MRHRSRVDERGSDDHDADIVPGGRHRDAGDRDDRPKALTLSLRRPAWAGDGFALQVNGERAGVNSKPGWYIDLTRTWKSGDTVTIAMPRTLRLARLPDNPRRAAVVWGPIVLAGDLGPQPRRAEDGDGDGPTTATTTSPVIVTNRPVSNG